MKNIKLFLSAFMFILAWILLYILGCSLYGLEEINEILNGALTYLFLVLGLIALILWFFWLVWPFLKQWK
jgi:hypothetical protein